MARDWKPGDRALVVVDGRERIAEMDDGGQWQGAWHGFGVDPETHSARPLLVIDTESHSERQALISLFRKDGLLDTLLSEEATHMRLQRALRDLADPKPVKPQEPTGLGAVVVDRKGVTWVRTFLLYGTGWVPSDENTGRTTWSDIDAVEVLSQGVTP